MGNRHGRGRRRRSSPPRASRSGRSPNPRKVKAKIVKKLAAGGWLDRFSDPDTWTFNERTERFTDSSGNLIPTLTSLQSLKPGEEPEGLPPPRRRTYDDIVKSFLP